MRILENGTIDPAFPNGQFGFSSMNTVDVLPNGQMIVGGVKPGNIPSRARINSDGTIDTAYGTTALPASIKSPRILKLFGDGSALVVYDATATKSEMIKFDADGNLTAFDTGTGFNGIIKSFEIFGDGRIMVAGDFHQYNGTYVNGVARLIGMSDILGVSETAGDLSSVTVYPNPAQDKIYIQSTKGVSKIELFSLDGKLLQSWSVSDETIDTSRLESGCYFVKISSGNGSVTKKILKR